MSTPCIRHGQQAHEHSMLHVDRDDDGQVWLCVVPTDRYRMTFDGKRTGGIAFPLPPDLAAAIGQSLIDEALTATRQGQAGAH